MDTSKLVPAAIAGALIYAAYKYGPAPVKAMALGVAGVMVAKLVPIPYVSDAVA